MLLLHSAIPTSVMCHYTLGRGYSLDHRSKAPYISTYLPVVWTCNSLTIWYYNLEPIYAVKHTYNKRAICFVISVNHYIRQVKNMYLSHLEWKSLCCKSLVFIMINIIAINMLYCNNKYNAFSTMKPKILKCGNFILLQP